jgi:hypothetical protein
LEWIKLESTSWLAKKKRRDTRPCRQLRRVRQVTPDQKSYAAPVAVVSPGIPKSLFL